MEQLFGSKTRVKLLELFVSNPNRPFYVREITRKIDEQINSVRRELANLLNIGILKSHDENNRLYYEVNQNYEHFGALRAIFTGTKVDDAKKVTKAGKGLQAKLKELGAVDVLAYLGTFTGDPVTGIDILIVGDVNKTKIEKYVAQLEEEEGRELRYAVMKTDEFIYRRDINDRFVSMVLLAKKTVIHDPKGLVSDKIDAETPKKNKKG